MSFIQSQAELDQMSLQAAHALVRAPIARPLGPETYLILATAKMAYLNTYDHVSLALMRVNMPEWNNLPKATVELFVAAAEAVVLGQGSAA